MSTSGKAFSVLLMANIIGLGWYLYKALLNDPELANKPEWSALQIAEAKYRNDPGDDLIITHIGERDIIGIKSAKTKNRVWILGKSEIIPRLKSMPQEGSVRLTRSEFEKIKSTIELNEETEKFLLNSIDE